MNSDRYTSDFCLSCRLMRTVE
uniref:Uncharacterized protein n=1 Tax=Anguilla anguilla TaxID=7936 RepID=A0A0E9PUF0_ANGAN